MPDESKPYFCYVLWSAKAQKHYIGITENVEKRLSDHNTGISKWTKRYVGTWELIWTKEFKTLGAARSFENRLKRQKGGNGFQALINTQPGSSSGS